MSITLIQHRFTPQKISYKLYIQDSFICYMNQYPDEEYQLYLYKTNATEYTWNYWIKMLYKEAYIEFINKLIGVEEWLYLYPINENIKYNIFALDELISDNACFKIKAFENKNDSQADRKCFKFLIEYVKANKVNNKIKIQFQ